MGGSIRAQGQVFFFTGTEHWERLLREVLAFLLEDIQKMFGYVPGQLAVGGSA